MRYSTSSWRMQSGSLSYTSPGVSNGREEMRRQLRVSSQKRSRRGDKRTTECVPCQIAALRIKQVSVYAWNNTSCYSRSTYQQRVLLRTLQILRLARQGYRRGVTEGRHIQIAWSTCQPVGRCGSTNDILGSALVLCCAVMRKRSLVLMDGGWCKW